MTAYITYIPSPLYEEIICTMCDTPIGKYIYYYDRNNTHISDVCAVCICDLKSDAINMKYPIEEKCSEYMMNANSKKAVVTVIRRDTPQKCNKCDTIMINCSYVYDVDNEHYVDVCYFCCETLKYVSRRRNDSISIIMHNKKIL